MNDMKDFDSVQKGRRTIRHYDVNEKIDRRTMEAILKDSMSAPSSFNMQPCRFVIVESEDWKQKIRPFVQFNQLQNDTSAAMIFILGDYQSFSNGPRIFQYGVDNGFISKEAMEERLAQIGNYYSQASRQALKERILLDSGILLMNLMLTARNYGYETCTMGAFDREKIMEVLGMDKERYFPVVILSIGKAAEEGKPSYRLPVEEISFWK